MKASNVRFIEVVIFVAALTLAAHQTHGQEERNLSLSDCLNISLANNLDIKIAKLDALIKDEDVLLAKSIFDTFINGKVAYTDDQFQPQSSLYGTKTRTNEYNLGLTKELPTGTEFTFNYNDTRTSTDRIFTEINPYHGSEISFSLKQPVLKNFLGYVDRGTVKLSRIEAEVAGVKAMDRIENAIADIEKAYWQLVFEYQSVALSEELTDQAERLYSVYEKNAKSGLVEDTELYETEANYRTRLVELEVARNSLITASNNLKLLMNEDGDFLIVPENVLEVLGGKADLVESLKEAFVANRAYKMKKKELEGKELKLKMKENSLWPEVDIVGTYAANGIDQKFEKASKRLSTDKFPKYYGGIEVRYPLENSEARGEYKKAFYEKEKGILEIIQVEKNILTSINEKVRNVNLTYENSQKWERVKNIQYTKMMDEAKKLSYGRSSTKNVVDYQRDYTNAALRSYLSVLLYYRSLIDLENEKDTLLEKVGIVEK